LFEGVRSVKGAEGVPAGILRVGAPVGVVDTIGANADEPLKKLATHLFLPSFSRHDTILLN
jgi:hypothetical protein